MKVLGRLNAGGLIRAVANVDALAAQTLVYSVYACVQRHWPAGDVGPALLER